MAKPTCSIDGCVKQVKARGLCSTHYDRARVADPDGFRRTSKRVDASGIPLQCSVESCSERVHAKMMCRYHYSRARRFGDASDVFDGRVCDWCGSTFRVNERGDRRKRFCCAECRSEFYNEARRMATEKRRLETVLLCKQCGIEFISKGTLGRKYCSDYCRAKWARDHESGCCSADGCVRPVRARGMCVNHYKEWHVANNPGVDPNPKHEMQCAACGKTVFKTKSGSRQPVCSYECRYVVQHGRSKQEADAERLRERAKRRQLVVRPSLRFRLVIKYPEDTYRSVLFTSVRCGYCGDYFVWDNRLTTSGIAKYCSDACRTSAHYARRALRRGVDYHGRSISSAVRREVYERDGWVCQLCFEPVVETEKFGRWSPTVDHIIPRSMQLVPDHSPSNLRLAHNYCNAIRGDGSGTNLPIGREALSA